MTNPKGYVLAFAAIACAAIAACGSSGVSARAASGGVNTAFVRLG